MIVSLILILIIALASYWVYKHQRQVINLLDGSKLGSELLSWLHSVIFDFKMEDPDRVPKQITFGFIVIVIIIGVISIMIAGSNQ